MNRKKSRSKGAFIMKPSNASLFLMTPTTNLLFTLLLPFLVNDCKNKSQGLGRKRKEISQKKLLLGKRLTRSQSMKKTNRQAKHII